MNALWRRALQLAGTVLGLAVLNFFLLRLAPGDVAQVIASEAGSASAEYLAALREQFVAYLGQLLQLNLGHSFRHGMPVAQLIGERLPATLLLMAASIGFALVLGVALGVLAAHRPGRWLDALVSGLALLHTTDSLPYDGLWAIPAAVVAQHHSPALH